MSFRYLAIGNSIASRVCSSVYLRALTAYIFLGFRSYQPPGERLSAILIPFQVPGILTFETPLILLTGWCANPQTDVYPCSSAIVELLPTHPVLLFPFDGWYREDAAGKFLSLID